MQKKKFARNAAIFTLLLGTAFLAANIYFGANHSPKLANMFFVFAALCDVIFLVFVVMWVAIKTWLHEPARPPMQMPKPMPGAAAGKMPGPPQP